MLKLGRRTQMGGLVFLQGNPFFMSETVCLILVLSVVVKIMQILIIRVFQLL